ncbi:MAG: LamG domain-containing protein [Planctomycetales bacterium]|nr:LamG domain-containing protein [Planctomycetales bacterium]
MLTGRRFVFVVFALAIAAQSLSAQTIFRYSGFQGDGKNLPTVKDAGPAGNDGTADATTKLTSDIPTVGVPSTAGNRGFNGQAQGGIVSGGTAELLNDAIASAGGFTMESWFNWNGAGSINSIIDYAGTEKLVLDVGAGAGNEVRMRINSDGSLDSIIGTVNPDEWHYVASVFDTQGAAVDNGSISGVFRLYLDGNLMNTTDVLTISNFGDSLNRPIGIAKHPLNFDADRFNGFVFEPRVSLGALNAGELLYVVPEPAACTMLLGATMLLALRVRRSSR